MSRAFVPPTECPVCGETVPRDAKACPGCGADERSGWNVDDARYDGLDLPDDAFDDDEADGHDAAPARSSARKPARRGTTGWFWMLVAGVLLVLFILSAFIR
jgi:hypothetical protein